MRDEEIREGDVVRVRQWNDMANEFGVYNDGNILISTLDIMHGYKHVINLPFDSFGNCEWWNVS